MKAGDQNAKLYALQNKSIGAFTGASAVSFRGVYPYGVFDFGYADVPLSVKLTVFNPKIPLNLKDSALPAAVMVYDFENHSAQTQAITFMASQLNPVGYQGDAPVKSRRHFGFGYNENKVTKHPDRISLRMGSLLPDDWAGAGDMTLTLHGASNRYSGVAEWENLKELEAAMSSGKGLGIEEYKQQGYPWVKRTDQTLVGALAHQFVVPANKSVRGVVVLTWNFPNALNGVLQWKPRWHGRGCQYTNWFTDSGKTATDAAALSALGGGM